MSPFNRKPTPAEWRKRFKQLTSDPKRHSDALARYLGYKAKYYGQRKRAAKSFCPHEERAYRELAAAIIGQAIRDMGKVIYDINRGVMGKQQKRHDNDKQILESVEWLFSGDDSLDFLADMSGNDADKIRRWAKEIWEKHTDAPIP